MNAIKYRIVILNLLILLAVSLVFAFEQRSELDSMKESLENAAFRSVTVQPVDSVTGSGVMTRVKGPTLRELIFPVGVTMDRDSDNPSSFLLKWFGHETEIELSATSYKTTRIRVGSNNYETIVAEMERIK